MKHLSVTSEIVIVNADSAPLVVHSSAPASQVVPVTSFLKPLIMKHFAVIAKVVPVNFQLIPAVVQRTAPGPEEIPFAVDLLPSVFLIGAREHLAVLLRIQIIKVIFIFLKSGQTMSVVSVQKVPFAVKNQPAVFLVKRFVITVFADRAIHDVIGLVLNSDPAFCCILLSVFVEVVSLSIDVNKTIFYDRSVFSGIICSAVHLKRLVFRQFRFVVFAVRRKTGNLCTIVAVCARLLSVLGEIIHCATLIGGWLCAGQKIPGLFRSQISFSAFCKQPGLWSFRFRIIEKPIRFSFCLDGIPSSLILRLLRCLRWCWSRRIRWCRSRLRSCGRSWIRCRFRFHCRTRFRRWSRCIA